jgi:probable HAF family extracellular repeat protein
MVGLGDLPGGGFQSWAYGASSDGSVVVGFGTSAAGREAFRWTAAGGMVGLGDLPGSFFDSTAYAVSGDGSAIVGASNGAFGPDAFVWTEANGMERPFDVLVANGATGLEGWLLREARAISADGRWVVGYGVNPRGVDEAFLADLAPIPLPPAAWLFVGALGLLGGLCRRGR